MEHPNRVTELVLRGVFLLRNKEVNWFYQGPGANYLFPEDWDMYCSSIPEEEQGDMIAAYGKRLRGELGEEGLLSYWLIVIIFYTVNNAFEIFGIWLLSCMFCTKIWIW